MKWPKDIWPSPRKSGTTGTTGKIGTTGKLGKIRGIGQIGRGLRDNLWMRIFSVVFAVGLWGFVNLGERDAEKTLVVPLELRGVPERLLVRSPVEDTIDVRLRGPSTLLGTIDERRQVVILDLSQVRSGRTSFKIDTEMLAIPRGVRVVRMSPAQVDLDIEKLIEREAPVVIDFGNSIPRGFQVAEVSISPREVTISGPESAAESAKEIRTETITLTPGPRAVERKARLVAPEGLSLSQDRVDVRMRIEEVVERRQRKSVAITVAGLAEGLTARTSRRTADIVLRGPERLLGPFEPMEGWLRVDVAGMTAGTHRVPLSTVVPEGIEAEAEPVEIDVVLREKGKKKK